MAEPKFEKDLERLEQIVESLESGGLPLDDALKRFEEGIKIAVRCEKALADAERKVEILVRNAKGEIEAQPFGGEDKDEKDQSGQQENDREDADSAEKPPTDQKPARDSEGGLLF